MNNACYFFYLIGMELEYNWSFKVKDRLLLLESLVAFLMDACFLQV